MMRTSGCAIFLYFGLTIDLAAYRRKYHSKTIRKNVTIPEWLADLASEENINFSQTLSDALKEKLRV
ncbi:MAG: hypothetical protein WAK52_04470 [Trichococcus sp.]